MIKPPGSPIRTIGAIAASVPVERTRGEADRLLVALEAAAALRARFVVDETVTARLVESLPQGRWAAIVKNAALTLQVPASTASSASDRMRTGETLSLQVTALSPHLTFARVDPPLAGLPAVGTSGAVAVQLSEAGKAISALFQAGERGLPPGQAPILVTLMPDPLAPPAARAQQIAQAIAHSGLFYESHLAAWTEGRLPIDSLRGEPQARLAQERGAEAPLRRADLDPNAELGGLVRRQLDTLDGRPMAFAGLAWPGQPAELRIQRESADDAQHEPTEERDAENDPQAPAWTTQLHLVLPVLGALGAQLRVFGSQVTLTMNVADDGGAALLAAHRARLASALQASGLTLTGLTVRVGAAAHGQTPQA